MRKERAEALWRLKVAAFLLAVVVWRNLFPLDDPDVWWHLKTGELIAKTRSIPRFDIFSYTINGQRWVSFEWLAQVLLYLAYESFGAEGLVALKALVVAAAFALFLPLAGGGFWAGLLLACAAWSSGGLAARPLVFDLLLMVLLLRRLKSAADPPWISLIVIHALWANLHGGAAVLGAGTVALKALAESLGPRPAVKWWAAAALCATAAGVNPHGLALFSHLGATLSFTGRELIGDWRPLSSLANAHGVLLLSALAAAALSWRREPLLSLQALALGGAALLAVRHLSLFEPVAAALAAGVLERRWPVAPGPRPALALAAAAALLFSQSRSVAAVERAKEAADFLDQAGLHGRLFNEYQLGGYLIWRGYPRRLVFVDGRNVEYGADFIRDALHWQEPRTWDKLDKRWRFDGAVIEASPDWRTGALDGSADWSLIFWDDACLVYARRTPSNAETIRRWGYRRFTPRMLDGRHPPPELTDSRARAGLLAELDRAALGSPHNANARRLKAVLLSAE